MPMTYTDQTVSALASSELFASLDPSRRESVVTASKMQTVRARCPIYLGEPDNAIFLVASGRVKACAETPDDKQQLLYLIGVGEVFGERVLFGRADRETYYETLEDSSILVLSADRIRYLARVEIQFLLALTAVISARRDLVERRLRQVLCSSGEDRLVQYLLELSNRYGETTSTGISLSLRLSHQDLANAIGTTRETVTVILGRLQRDRLVRNQRQQITILDPKGLVRRLKSQADPLVA